MNNSSTTTHFNSFIAAINHAKEHRRAVAVIATVDGETFGDFFNHPEFKRGSFISTLHPIVQRTPGSGITAIRVTHDFRSCEEKNSDMQVFSNAQTSIIELTNELEHLEQVQKELMTGEPKYVLKALDKFVLLAPEGAEASFNHLVTNPTHASIMGLSEALDAAKRLEYMNRPCAAVKIENAIAYRAHILRSMILTIRTTY